MKTKTTPFLKLLPRILFAVVVGALPTMARGQIFIGNTSSGTVGEYSVSGAPVSPSLVAGLHSPTGLVVSGTNLFIVNSGSGTVGQYTTTGLTVNASLISGLNAPVSIAVSGSNLFVASNGSGTIAKYTTAGVLVSGTLVSGLNGPWGLAASGTNLFVTNFGSGTIGKYTTSGSAVNTALVSGLNGPWALALSGTNLFVSNVSSGTVGAYTTTGGTVAPALLSGFSFPAGLAVTDSHLFVADNSGVIGEYTTAGAIVNPSLIADANGPWAIAAFSDHSVVLRGNSAIGIPGAIFSKFGNPAMNNIGHVAFQAAVTGPGLHSSDNSGLWADNSLGARQLLARTGTLAPGTGSALFKSLGDPVYNNHDAVAFSATLVAGSGDATTTPVNNTFGLWTSNGGTLHLVARGDTQPPGVPAGALFKRFISFVLPDQGGLVFLATMPIGPGGVVPHSDTGLWAVDTVGTLRLIVREGDVIEGRTVTALTFLPALNAISGQTRGFNQNTGDLIYRATFSDGSTGLFKVIVP